MSGMYRSFRSTSFAMASCSAFLPQTIKTRIHCQQITAELESSKSSSHLKKVMAEMAVVRRRWQTAPDLGLNASLFISLSVWTPAGQGAGPDLSSLCRAKAFAGSLQAIRAAKAHLTDRNSRSKDGWGEGGGSLLVPYHHGGPHTELKPDSGKSEAEQRQEISRKTSVTSFTDCDTVNCNWVNTFSVFPLYTSHQCFMYIKTEKKILIIKIVADLLPNPDSSDMYL